MGHEIIHARHKASGVFYEWKEKYNEWAGTYLSEVLAYQWNLRMLYLFNFPGALDMYYKGWQTYINLFLQNKDT